MQKILYFIVVMIAICQKTVAQGSWIVLGNCYDLSIKISLPDTSFSKLDPNIKNVLMPIEIINKSNSNIRIKNPLLDYENFNSVNIWSINGAYTTYRIELYDSVRDLWLVQDNMNIFASINYQVDSDYEHVTEVIPGKKIIDNKQIFFVLGNLEPGKYKLTAMIGVKVKENTFTTFKSNTIEFNLKR